MWGERVRCAYWAEDRRTDSCGGTGWERTGVKADLGFGFEELMSPTDTGDRERDGFGGERLEIVFKYVNFTYDRAF